MADYVQAIKPRVLDWLESVRHKDSPWGRYKYSAHMPRPYAGIASGYAMWILSMLDEIKNVSAAHRAEAIDFFQSCQDPETGLFMDPLITEPDLQGKEHSWNEVRVQMTDIKYGLDYLGAEPKYPLPKQRFTDLTGVDMEQWVMRLPWSNPWLAGWLYDQTLLAFYQSDNGLPADQKQNCIATAFDTFERYVLDAHTGLPIAQGCDDLAVGMAGLFKVLSIYNTLNRPIPYGEKAIDTVLALQQPNGEFGAGADMCINWDSVWVLREIDKRLAGNYKREQIAQAMHNLADCLLREYGKPDGGFAFNRDHCIRFHMSILCSEPHPEGDMVGTLQSIFCMQYADEYALSCVSNL